jgi:hypothetical protein
VSCTTLCSCEETNAIEEGSCCGDERAAKFCINTATAILDHPLALPNRLGQIGPVVRFGAPSRVLDMPVTADWHIQWTPNGRALTYIDAPKGVSNIWSLPVEGGAAKQFDPLRFRPDL